ncbi:MAG: class II fructose-bisphosphate aldolase [Deltaproteobacteria bacterium]|nr:class II fructose-bisphosphate aldolase [Deltaproteobacteria bacterium]
MIVDLSHILKPARQGRYAVGAFNIYNLETIDAVLAAADELRSPVILALGERYLKNFPIRAIAAITTTLARDSRMPVALHLDHAQKLESIEQAISAGFTSVMIDGSKLPLAENIAITKKAVALARPRKVTVEGELGRIGRTGVASSDLFTDPDEARQFMEETGVDALAVAVGTVHGLYKGEPTLDLERLTQIAEKVTAPLVLHGGSGLPDHLIKSAIQLGVAKLNINTEVSIRGVDAVRGFLESKGNENTRLEELMVEARGSMVEVVKKYIEFFGSAGKVPG